MVTNNAVWETAIFFMLALISFTLGCFFILLIVNNPQERLIKKNTSKKNITIQFLLLTHQGKLTIAAIVLFLLIVAMTVQVYDSSSWSLIGLWVREGYQYHNGANQTQVMILEFLQLIAFGILGLLYGSKKKKTSLILFIFLFFLDLTTGARTIVVHVAEFLFIPVFLLRRKKIIQRLFLWSIILVYVVPLRKMQSHGLFAYSGLESLLTGTPSPLSFMASELTFTYYYYFIFGFFATISTQQIGSVNWDTIIVSLNPLPGQIAGWYEIAPALRITLNAPFSLYGEVFSMGMLFTITFFFVLGIVFGIAEIWIRKKWKNHDIIPALITTGLLCFYCILAYEYNLRSSLRFVYYAIGFMIIYNFFASSIIFLSQKTKKYF